MDKGVLSAGAASAVVGVSVGEFFLDPAFLVVFVGVVVSFFFDFFDEWGEGCELCAFFFFFFLLLFVILLVLVGWVGAGILLLGLSSPFTTLTLVSSSSESITKAEKGFVICGYK
jgi:hypothetical protein